MAKEVVKKVTFPAAGKYVVAVSGGVDSVTLLDMLSRASSDYGYQLIVGHFDHGMRRNSAKDQRLAQELARQYGLAFYSRRGKLGRSATEAQARQARYEFLNQLKTKINARAVVTAHHLDDAMETAILNAARGATRWGLTPMHLAREPVRPLLNIRKAELTAYAQRHDLSWREDPTNQNLNVTRNFIRSRLIPQLEAMDWQSLLLLADQNRRSYQSAAVWANHHAKAGQQYYQLNRSEFVMLDHFQKQQVLLYLLKKWGKSLERPRLEALIGFCNTAKNDKEHQMAAKLRGYIRDDMITLVNQG